MPPMPAHPRLRRLLVVVAALLAVVAAVAIFRAAGAQHQHQRDARRAESVQLCADFAAGERHALDIEDTYRHLGEPGLAARCAP